MIEIEKPRIECVENPGDGSYGKYVVEPLERGYGTTLGNSLRRILLSSLPGTAVTSIKIAGDKFDEAVVKYIRKKHNVLIGDRTAEEIKMQIGCVFPRPEEQSFEVKGRCLMTGLPKKIEITSKETVEVLQETAVLITDAIHSVVEKTPPELLSDVSRSGITLTGGGSLRGGLDEYIHRHTGIHVHIADDCISCVAFGLGKLSETLHSMQPGAIHLERKKLLLHLG